MEVRTDAPPVSPDLWKKRWRQFGKKLKVTIPFAAGIIATLLGLLLYSALFPAPQPLTLKEVDNAVARAMAYATPAPAYSAQVYQAIQPSLVLIQVKSKGTNAEEENGLGSGVLISAQGDILTALHVVENAEEIQLTFADGTQSSATVVST